MTCWVDWLNAQQAGGNVSECLSGELHDEWQYDGQHNGLMDRSERYCDDALLADVTRLYAYDNLTRPTSTDLMLRDDGTQTVTQASHSSEYDSYFARPTSMTWRIDPTGNGDAPFDALRMYNKYDVNGYLFEQGNSIGYVGDDNGYPQPNPAAWHGIEAMTPTGQTNFQRYGNGLEQTTNYYPATWQMRNTQVPNRFEGSAALMDYDYQYDLFGNLKQQTRHSVDGMMDFETFTYDRLHRLTNSTRQYDNGQMDTINYDYDALGNILSKSDFGTGYVYTGTNCDGASRPNAVSGVQTVLDGQQSYGYDCNGNMTSGGTGRSLNYDAYNKPVQIAVDNIDRNAFWYDADQQRYLQTKNNNQTTTLYLDKVYERTGNVHKFYVGGFAVFTADYTNPSNTGITYLHQDRLGSVAIMSTDNGDMAAGTGRGFDPFGKPREIDWQNSNHEDDASNLDGDLNGYATTTRGFTGHEHLNETSLIHMNGRTYDYSLGRFLSVDPVIQAPQNSQSLNPYSYIMNNPMAGTDPTGYVIECNSDNTSCTFAGSDVGSVDGVFEDGSVVATLTDGQTVVITSHKLSGSSEGPTTDMSGSGGNDGVPSENGNPSKRNNGIVFSTDAQLEGNRVIQLGVGKNGENLDRTGSRLVPGVSTADNISQCVGGTSCPTVGQVVKDAAIDAAGGALTKGALVLLAKVPGGQQVINYFVGLSDDALKGLRDKLGDKKFKDFVADEHCIDCSELAEDLFIAAGRQGRIIEIRGADGGWVNTNRAVFGDPESYQYHQIFTDGKFVYDPRQSSEPIPFDKYLRDLSELNGGGNLVIKDVTPE